MPSNFLGIFDHLEEFILSKVPRLNFGGSGDTRAKEMVQNRLLHCIKEAFVNEMVEDDLGDSFPLVIPPSRPSLPPESKRPREGDSKSMAELWQCLYSQQAQQARNRPFTPRTREGTRNTAASPRLVGLPHDLRAGLGSRKDMRLDLPRVTHLARKGKEMMWLPQGLLRLVRSRHPPFPFK